MSRDQMEQDILEAIRREVGGCREDVGTDKCWEPAEYILWGKPRCYDHAAADHVGHGALGTRSQFALVDLAHLARRIASRIHEDYPLGDNAFARALDRAAETLRRKGLA
jgi:hypothetical protein